jgi:hypothetical protein
MKINSKKNLLIKINNLIKDLIKNEIQVSNHLIEKFFFLFWNDTILKFLPQNLNFFCDCTIASCDILKILIEIFFKNQDLFDLNFKKDFFALQNIYNLNNKTSNNKMENNSNNNNNENDSDYNNYKFKKNMIQLFLDNAATKNFNAKSFLLIFYENFFLNKNFFLNDLIHRHSIVLNKFLI